MSQFQSLITVSPLGLMYGSAGGFLSPENLVGRSNTKFPPDAATIAGLLFNANREQKFADHQALRDHLVVAGPFWAKRDQPNQFYVPISWHRVIGEKEDDEWSLVSKKDGLENNGASDSPQWRLNQQKWQRQNDILKPAYFWQSISAWSYPIGELREREAIALPPWKPVSFLHPKIKLEERHVVEKDGLFLENAIQLSEEYCLVYLCTLPQSLQSGWYRFGGEGHLVEVESHCLSKQHIINRLLRQPIRHAFALVTPGVWGSNKHSYRYPKHPKFPQQDLKLLTDKAVPFRYRIGQTKADEAASDCYNPNITGRLSRGRYAVPAGSVYVLNQPLNLTWWDFPEDWFPQEGFSLKQLGCGLSLPIDIQGVPECIEKLTA